MFGEKAGVPFAPVGIYDFNNRLVYTVESDFNGVYDVLLPSTNHISCPTPVRRLRQHVPLRRQRPGHPRAPEPELQPAVPHDRDRVRGAPRPEHPADLAPTQVGLTIESPATGLPQAVTCALDAATPQLFAVSQPYVNGQRRRSRSTASASAPPRAPVRSPSTARSPCRRPAWNDTHDRRHGSGRDTGRARTSSRSRRTTARAPSTA